MLPDGIGELLQSSIFGRFEERSHRPWIGKCGLDFRCNVICMIGIGGVNVARQLHDRQVFGLS
jgi:hypothetical protein